LNLTPLALAILASPKIACCGQCTEPTAGTDGNGELTATSTPLPAETSTQVAPTKTQALSVSPQPSQTPLPTEAPTRFPPTPLIPPSPAPTAVPDPTAVPPTLAPVGILPSAFYGSIQKLNGHVSELRFFERRAEIISLGENFFLRLYETLGAGPFRRAWGDLYRLTQDEGRQIMES